MIFYLAFYWKKSADLYPKQTKESAIFDEISKQFHVSSVLVSQLHQMWVFILLTFIECKTELKELRVLRSANTL